VGEQNRYGYARWSSFHADGNNEVLRLKVQDLIWKAPWAGEVARRFGEEYETPRRTIDWACSRICTDRYTGLFVDIWSTTHVTLSVEA
jgi:hypothetical protein